MYSNYNIESTSFLRVRSPDKNLDNSKGDCWSGQAKLDNKLMSD